MLGRRDGLIREVPCAACRSAFSGPAKKFGNKPMPISKQAASLPSFSARSGSCSAAAALAAKFPSTPFVGFGFAGVAPAFALP